jgi:hypothetical protein
MKKFLIGIAKLLLVFTLLPHLARAERKLDSGNTQVVTKVCSGASSTGVGDVIKHTVILIQIKKDQISLKTTKGEYGTLNGTFPKVSSKAGKLTFDAGKPDPGDYHEFISLDEALLQPGSQGTLELTGNGEGHFQHLFDCKDQSPAVTTAPPEAKKDEGMQ